MKINALTDKPQSLINAINKAMKDEDLKTWKIVLNNKNETLYSHTPEQWVDKALVQPIQHDEYVLYHITWWKNNGEPDEATKGYILGRFVEILMVHFRSNFERLVVS